MSLKRNVLANYVGQGWAALMGIAFVPLYVKVLGAESYGLIGIFAILQAWMGLLDLGLTPTLNREMAKLGAKVRSSDHVRDLLRSLESIYAVVAAGMVGSLWIGAPWLANGWLQVGKLSSETVVISLRLMAFVLATRWLEQIYRGALQGLEDQVWLNSAQAILATLRWAGAYVIVAFVTPSVIAFFWWQGAVSVATGIVLVRRTYARIPAGSRRGRFSVAALSEIKGFATGMFISAGLSFALMQADKLIISKLLPLDQLGYYMVAATAAGGLLQLVTPMNAAIFPRLTYLVARSDLDGLSRTYQQACEVMAAIVVPVAMVLVFFPREVLLAWTGDDTIATAVSPMLALLVLGTLLNGLMNVPYMLQLAYGWTELSIRINFIAVAVIVPLMLYLVPRYGAVGAASCWAMLNAAYLLVGVHLMHRRLLPQAKWPWYRTAILAPLAAGSAASLALTILLPPARTRWETAATVLAVVAVTLPCVAFSLPVVRAVFFRRFAPIRKP